MNLKSLFKFFYIYTVSHLFWPRISGGQIFYFARPKTLAVDWQGGTTRRPRTVEVKGRQIAVKVQSHYTFNDCKNRNGCLLYPLLQSKRSWQGNSHFQAKVQYLFALYPNSFVDIRNRWNDVSGLCKFRVWMSSYPKTVVFDIICYVCKLVKYVTL